MTLAFRNHIDVTLSVAAQMIVGVTIEPRSRPPLGRLFAGKPAETLLAALPRLFSLCAIAHQVALLSALEAARGHQAPPLTRHRRITAVIMERFAELLRGVLVSRLACDRSALAQLQFLLQAVASLQVSAGAGNARQSRSATLSQIKMALAALGLGSVAEPVVRGTPLASIMDAARRAEADGGWKQMPAEHGVLSAADDDTVVARLI
ncbi:MAG: hydrogenase assembly protein HupF, partial [Bradyrhizobium sp.]